MRVRSIILGLLYSICQLVQCYTQIARSLHTTVLVFLCIVSSDKLDLLFHISHLLNLRAAVIIHYWQIRYYTTALQPLKVGTSFIAWKACTVKKSG